MVSALRETTIHVAVDSTGGLDIFGRDAFLITDGEGALDTTFDTDGRVTTTIGANFDLGQFVIVQPDGNIVVGGSSHNGTDYDFALARYNTNGSLDTSFDTDGKLITVFGSGNDRLAKVILQPDGKIIAVGYLFNGIDEDFALARYNTDGSLDTTFDSDGKVITPIGAGNDNGHAVVVQPGGKIVVAGDSNNGSNRDFALARYHSNGSLDTTFDGDGKTTTAIGSGDDYGMEIELQRMAR